VTEIVEIATILSMKTPPQTATDTTVSTKLLMELPDTTTTSPSPGNIKNTVTANIVKRNNKTVESTSSNGQQKHKRMCHREADWRFTENDDPRWVMRDIQTVYSKYSPATTSNNVTEIDSTDISLNARFERQECDDHESSVIWTESLGPCEEVRDEKKITSDEAFEEGHCTEYGSSCNIKKLNIDEEMKKNTSFKNKKSTQASYSTVLMKMTANTDKRDNKTAEIHTSNGQQKHKKKCIREIGYVCSESVDYNWVTRCIQLGYLRENSSVTMSSNNIEIDSTDISSYSRLVCQGSDEQEPIERRTESPGPGEKGSDENEITTDEAFEEGQPEDVDSNRTWPVP